eukprot:gene9356-1443_t
MKLLLVLTVLYFVSSSSAVCVHCLKSANLLGIENTEEILESAPMLDFFQISEDCQDRSVCFEDCSKYFSGCKKKAFFTDFLKGMNDKDAEKSYVKVCIKREYSKEKNFYLKKEMVQLLKKKAGCDFSNSDSMEKIMDKYKKKCDKKDRAKYFIYATEIMMSVKSICKETIDKDEIERALKRSIRRGSTSRETIFSFRENLAPLKNYFTEKIRDMRRIRDDFDRKDKDKMEKYVDSFIEGFVKNDLAKGQTYVCNCDHFVSSNLVAVNSVIMETSLNNHF